MPEQLGAYDLPLDEALNRAIRVIARDFQAGDQPDIDSLKHVVLKQGKIVTKVAKYWGIRDRNTGQHNSNNLNLITLRRTKKKGWEYDIEHSITIEDKDGDNAILKLFNFLATLPEIKSDGEFLILGSENIDARMGKILETISSSEQNLHLISKILSWVNTDKKAGFGLIKLASDDPVRSKSLVAALNYGRYYKALELFQRLVDEDHLEKVYQDFLEKNIWMFGSEYSELLPIRQLTRNVILDFPLRRTVDGYLEVIEIKTPMGNQPLYLDKNRYLMMRSEVTDYIAQVREQLTALDDNKFMIQAENGFVASKVRGKLVIGRDYGDIDQLKALRRDNADQNRVEILTFDQIIRIAKRMLQIMTEESSLLGGLDLHEFNNSDSMSSKQ